jgi:hypothetical protein
VALALFAFKIKPNIFKAFIQSQNITYKSNTFPTLAQNEPCTYLGIHLIPSLKWNLQKEITLQKAKEQCKLYTSHPLASNKKLKY